MVFDTNVFVSAYGFGGKPAELMRAMIEERADLITSPDILAELARVLADRLDFDQDHVEAVLLQIARVAEVVKPRRRIQLIADEADNRILECAVAGEADAIVSGDHHLLELGEFRRIPVLTPAVALRQIT